MTVLWGVACRPHGLHWHCSGSSSRRTGQQLLILCWYQPLRRLGGSGTFHPRRVARTRERVIGVRFLFPTAGSGGTHRVAPSRVPGESRGNYGADCEPILISFRSKGVSADAVESHRPKTRTTTRQFCAALPQRRPAATDERKMGHACLRVNH